mmetsp:Transcript_52175/g.117177  ORF Transcript_52175/g.117177 Transcript_52175/m.117177 type:complete len:129 (-) Transcript_52175:120-506(-)
MQIRAHRHRTPRPGSAREKRSRTYARDLSSISLGLSLLQVIHCMAYPKEVVVVPDDWWHATCNMMPYTLAVGGQTWDNAHLPPFQARSQESREETLERWRRREPHSLNHFQKLTGTTTFEGRRIANSE